MTQVMYALRAYFYSLVSLIFQVTPILGVFLIILCIIFVVEPVRGQIERNHGVNDVVADDGEVVIRHSWFNDVKHILRS